MYPPCRFGARRLMATILVIDDDKNSRIALEAGLKTVGHEVLAATNGRDGLDICRDAVVDLVLTDFKMPGVDGIKFLQTVRKLKPDVAVVLLSGEGTIETAVRALKEGAYDYLTKPIRMREVLKCVAKAIEARRLVIENRALRDRIASLTVSGRVVCASAGLKKVIGVVEQVAPTRATVLITGESGTGKTVVAQAVHESSPRREGPFVTVSCAALPETLLEAELFGHEKGAFTGAVSAREGRFEAADAGTIFLDEVGEMPAQTQTKLLRVLQDGEFERLGSNRTVKVDVRIVAATNRDLKAAIAQRTFREDLFYRLNVVSIEIPPLRSRSEDIPPLVHHFTARHASENGKTITAVEPEAMSLLLSYSWPGNVRELENAIARAVVMAKGNTITKDTLPDTILATATEQHGPQLPIAVGMSLADIEKVTILKTIESAKGDKELAANILGIGIATLYRKLKEIEEDQAGKA